MTFLELCQAYVREADIDRTALRPVSVVGQIGDLGMAVHWIRQAYIEIQNSKKNWAWMRGYFELATVAGQRRYAPSDCIDLKTSQPISRFKEWWLDDVENPPRCYPQASGKGGEYWLTYAPRNFFVQLYDIGNNATSQSMPAHISVDFDRSLLVGLTPNAPYVISGEFQRSAQVLTNDGDIPEMPQDYHYLIVYEALRKYGGSDIAPEVMARAETEGQALRSALINDQIPVPGDVMFAGRPLA
jgi:hypothetical protein